MGQALYRKYRSKSLSQIKGQEHIVATLRNAISQGKVSHAYLFTGPRGVGKTSVARILAHEVNQLPYDEQTTHIDIIEIDAASNRRIDEIRDLRDKIHISPASARYKVYIIDEVHMLTKEAFNALLKTLEEPPAHVIFILATTEAHKLPETIISRTQRFTFKPIDQATAVAHLRSIAKKEHLTISDEALALIAEQGDGSFRDSISLLDQLRSLNSNISADDVRQLLGMASVQAIQSLAKAIEQNNPATVIQTLQELYHQGYEPAQLAKQLAQYYRRQLLQGSGQAKVYTALLAALIDVPASRDSAAKLEIVAIDACLASTATPKPKAAAVQTVATVTQADSPPAATQTSVPTDDFATAWQRSLEIIKSQNTTLYGVLRMAKATQTDKKTVRLAFAFPFHQKKLRETSNQKLVAQILSQQLNKKISLECVLDKNLAIEKPQADTANQDTLSTISNIFGSAEVLES